MMNSTFRLYDLVAPTEDFETLHFETRAPLTLRRGQIGTIVMEFDGTAFEVEFADAQGQAFALLPIPTDKLMLLHDAPASAVA